MLLYYKSASHPNFHNRFIHSRTEAVGCALAVGEMRCGFPLRSGWSYCKVSKNWLQCVRTVASQPMSFYRNSFCSRVQLMTWICLPVTSSHTPCVTHSYHLMETVYNISSVNIQRSSNILTNYFNENKNKINASKHLLAVLIINVY